VSTLRLIVGVAGLNLLFVGIGYCVLATPLRGRRVLSWITYAGLALMIGAGLVGVVLSALAVFGAGVGNGVFAATAIGIALAGLSIRRLVPERHARLVASPAFDTPRGGPSAEIVATAAAFLLVVVCCLGLVGSFRSTPWLDDVWRFWLAKGIAIDRLGVDPRLFASSDTYVSFYPGAGGYYPLWWSLITDLDIRFVGALDLRAVDAQLGILAVAFLGSTARLLWGWVRPVFLWLGLLLLAASPALFRQVHGGGADLPLAFYFAIFVLAVLMWLIRRSGFGVVIATISGAVALGIKREALPQMLIFAAVATLFAARRSVFRAAALWCVVGVAWIVNLPWTAWRWEHGLQSDFHLSNALSFTYLRHHVHYAHLAISQVTHWSLTPREWPVVLPVFAVLVVAGLLRERRGVWLAPGLLLLLYFGFWVWALWSDPYNLVPTVAYRLIDVPMVLAAVLIPILAERLWSTDGVRRSVN
jgi:hypothetical protein